MAFNTAVFYDIENLLKGYKFSQEVAANLSLKEILDEIRGTGILGQIAVQRAYGNWSDPRLGILRGEINELGIDPIQVFGFSRDQKKNAADIQLAIDAIDLAHVRSGLDVFVIISGDGGFASLAKKLHEYGKTVIGCAYRNAANRTFQAVCDAFVGITDPDEEERPCREGQNAWPTGGTAVTDPRNIRLTAKVKPVKSGATELVVSKCREVLAWYASDSESKFDLARMGVHLSVVQEAVRFAIVGFEPAQLWFAKFSEFIQHACTGTELCLARSAQGQAVLMFRSAVRPGTEILPDVDLRDPQSAEGYRSLLAAGAPILRLPPAEELHAILGWICRNPPEDADFAGLIEAGQRALAGSVSSESVKFGLLCLITVQAFERGPEGAPLAEQRLTLQPDVRSPETLLGLLRATARNKLAGILGQLREDLLQRIIGELQA